MCQFILCWMFREGLSSEFLVKMWGVRSVVQNMSFVCLASSADVLVNDLNQTKESRRLTEQPTLSQRCFKTQIEKKSPQRLMKYRQSLEVCPVVFYLLDGITQLGGAGAVVSSGNRTDTLLGFKLQAIHLASLPFKMDLALDPFVCMFSKTNMRTQGGNQLSNRVCTHFQGFF